MCKRAFVTGVSAGWRVNRHPMLVYDYWNKSVAGAFIEVHPAAFAYSRSIRWPPRLQLYRLYIPSVGGGRRRRGLARGYGLETELRGFDTRSLRKINLDTFPLENFELV